MRNLLLDVIIRDHPPLDADRVWGIRSVRPDLRSSHGFRWPFPGGEAVPAGPLLDHSGECPRSAGDGLCAAFTWGGMASGSIPARTLLLVSWARTDTLGSSLHKARIGGPVMVHDVIDGECLVRQNGREADLSGADLRGADLRGANLLRADLSGADLRGAYLLRAYLRGTYLRGTYLRAADLSAADLRGADLREADLREADLRGANLRRANLYGALGASR